MQFLTPGERIKKIRNDLNIKQYELQECGFTRNYISMIECDKRKLNRNVAKKLVNAFNKKAQELNKDIKIDEEYILLTPKGEAKQYCLKELNNENVNLDEIMDICKEYKLYDVLKEVYMKRADLFYEKNEYTEAFNNYFEALEIHKNLGIKENCSFIYNKLGKCRYSLMYYDSAVLFFNKAYDYSLFFQDKITKKNSIYNLALCYSRLNDKEKSLKLADKYIELCDKKEDFNNYIYAIILKAIYFKYKKQYKEAINLYKNIINEFSDLQSALLGLVYNNLGILYFEIEDFKESLKYFNKSQEIRYKNNNPLLYHTLIYKAEIYMKESKYEKAEELIKNGLDLAYEFNDEEYILKGYLFFEKIYKYKKDNKLLEKIYEDILERFGDRKEKREVLDIYIKLALLKIENNDIESGKKMLYDVVRQKNT
ncbi:helix-turn-helix domain-containing protein (plasmid) [Haloimpatiens sp. FM7330]|uniref:helix-turn-helix domain-containing protein n=1 Tax=Haloimpatiens sp. FM7330 TaxID=3298610 RepID=UPI0037EDADE6